MRISDWSSDVCSSDLVVERLGERVVGANDEPSCDRDRPHGRRGGAACDDVDRGPWPSSSSPHDGGHDEPEPLGCRRWLAFPEAALVAVVGVGVEGWQIGRASCRERVCRYVENSVVAGSLKKKQPETQ